MVRTNVYIDGFNLYFGALKGTPYKWLDVDKMCQHVMPKLEVHRVRYFTAFVDGLRDPSAPTRQRMYLRALNTIPHASVHLGFFLTKKVTMPVASPPPPYIRVIKTEEKGYP